MVTSEEVMVGVASQLSVAVAVPVFAGNVLAVQSTVTLAGQVIVGAALSSTKIVCRQVDELPQSSAAFQVLLMVYSCGQPPAIVISADVIVGVPSQLSVAVAVPVLAGSVLAVQRTVILGGQVNTGPRLSSTKMVCTQELELPQSSAAFQVLVMVYSCGHAPAAVTSAEVIVGVASQLSVAVAVPVFAGKVLAVQRMVIFGGQVSTGPALSSTKMVWTHEPELPQSSAIFQVRVIVYSCGQLPAAVTSLEVKFGEASQLSVADGVPVLAGSVLAEQRMVMFGGQVKDGGVLSSTKMVCVQELELPQSSIAVKVLVIVSSCGHAPPTVTSENPIVGVPSQLSVAVALPVAAVAVLVPH
jgi:hypothetical protein